jgi:hypothetical protein
VFGVIEPANGRAKTYKNEEFLKAQAHLNAPTLS